MNSLKNLWFKKRGYFWNPKYLLKAIITENFIQNFILFIHYC